MAKTAQQRTSERAIISNAKLAWIRTMTLDYPSFNHKKWGQTKYRRAHPQISTVE